jgi:hypothetical protein
MPKVEVRLIRSTGNTEFTEDFGNGPSEDGEGI